MVKDSINTLASPCLILRENEPFLLDNTSNLTHEFLLQFKKTLLNFSCKTSCVKFDVFSKQNGLFNFPIKGDAQNFNNFQIYLKIAKKLLYIQNFDY